MIDWLRRSTADPVVEIGEARLPIAIRRHPRARRLTMRLAVDGSELRITMPQWCGTRDALAFAHARKGWIAQQLAKVPPTREIGAGSIVPYRGADVRITWQPQASRVPRLDGDALVLGGPEHRIAPRTLSWLEGQARALFADDLAHYCARAGEPLPALRLSRARRRWGSCSSERAGGRSIALNWRLVMAPDRVRRSVVAHEVAHLAHFDHSPAFHAHLARLFDDDLHAADLWLKREGPKLYHLFA